MKLSVLCRAIGIDCPWDVKELEITQITCNSKRVRPGGLFVCLDGTKRNGEEFANEAISLGAAAVLYGKGSEKHLHCEDTLLAMSLLCREFYGAGIERLKLIAVTGTNGKTTLVSLLESIFTAAGKKCGRIGTLGCFSSERRLEVSPFDPNANMTTPDPEELYPTLSQMSSDQDEFVFIEASSHALARKKLDALRFECGIFTNLSRDHLDYHKTIEEYCKAKARLAPLCDRFILNADSPFYRSILESGGITCSQKGKADFKASEVSLDKDGCTYFLESESASFGVTSRLSGSYTVMNTLEAAACALTLGIPPKHVARGIASLNSVSGRMERVTLPESADINVYIDYAHTPDALKQLLISARGISNGGRIVLLFGCGGERDAGKRSEMGSIASKYADLVIVTSDNSRSEDPAKIIDDILLGIDADRTCKVIGDRKEAIRYAIKEALANDVILLAGKGHEKYEIDRNGRHFFDEAEIVRTAWLEK